jgi:hypothetical protein
LEFNESDRLPASDEATSPPKARSGAKLVSAKVTIKNGGKRKVDPYCGGGGAVLLDEEDRNYEPIAEVYGIKGNTSVCGDGISPRFRDTLTLAFEVPEDMSVRDLCFGTLRTRTTRTGTLISSSSRLTLAGARSEPYRPSETTGSAPSRSLR